MLLGTSEIVPEENVQLYLDTEETAAGVEFTPRKITHPITVKMNGKTFMTIDGTDRHKPFLLPVAPDDEVFFIADIGRQQVLKQMHIDEHRAGDFIAYYTFVEQSGGTVVDRSPNQNDMTIHGASWKQDGEGSALSFDGDDDYSKVDQLNVDDTVDVHEFTVAIKYKVTSDTGGIQQLVEHRNDTTNFEWFIETVGSGNPHRMHFSVWQDGVSQDGVKSDGLNNGETQIVVGAYDGNVLELYLNGTYVGSKSISGDVEMGALYLGADAVGATSQHLEGEIYQFRLYYTALTESEVKTLTTVMDAEAEAK